MRQLYLAVTLLLAAVAHAQEPTVMDKQEKQNRDGPPAVNPLASSADILAYQPDLDNRRMGMDAYKRASFDYALRYFHWAARYADKPSEAMLASMYWDGTGVTRIAPSAMHGWILRPSAVIRASSRSGSVTGRN